jgi:hypothetical protein
MANKIFITLSSPIAPEQDGEFNEWYDTVHRKEILAMDGFVAMERYRTASQFMPPAASPDYQYLAIYEVEDLDLAMRSMKEGQANFTLSDSFDPAGAFGMSLEKIVAANT